MYCVRYSEKAIAVFGDTKPYKEGLKAIGGKYNARLRSPDDESVKMSGWIFPLAKKDAVDSFIACPGDYESCGEAKGPLRVVRYSEKAIAVFGDTKPIKEKLKKLGGKYNPSLKSEPGNEDCKKIPGWVFPKWKIKKVEESLNVKAKALLAIR